MRMATATTSRCLSRFRELVGTGSSDDRNPSHLTTEGGSGIMNPVAAPPHVTLSGDIVGEYVIEEERPDGRILLAPDLSMRAILARHGATPLSAEDFERHFGDLPTDDEG
jgi:hypothetical protein